MGEILDLIFKTYGLVGLLIAAPFVAVIFLWKENIRLNQRALEVEKEHIRLLEAANNKVGVAQEQRVEDAQDVSNRLVDLVSEQAALNKETNIVLSQIGGMLTKGESKHELPPKSR